MPIRRYLDGHKFDEQTVRLMGLAFEIALGSFGATPAHDDPVRATLARRIIAQAQAGERDPEHLCDAALNAVSLPDPISKSRTMNGALIDVAMQLRAHRELIDGSIIRLARSTQIQNQMQQRIRTSVALLERAGALKWSRNAPVPNRTANSPEPKGTFDGKSDSSSAYVTPTRLVSLSKRKRLFARSQTTASRPSN